MIELFVLNVKIPVSYNFDNVVCCTAASKEVGF